MSLHFLFIFVLFGPSFTSVRRPGEYPDKALDVSISAWRGPIVAPGQQDLAEFVSSLAAFPVLRSLM